MAQSSTQTSIPISLRPSPSNSRNAQTDSLPYLIARINADRGFKNLNEDALRHEILEQQSDHSLSDDKSKPTHDEADLMDIDEAPPAESPEDRRGRLYKARLEMISYAKQAQNQSLITLDFLSLLLRKALPAASNNTLSQHLKSTYPAGSLAFDRLPSAAPNPAQEARNKQTALGWTLTNLQSSADSLLAAADKLSDKMQTEARYWDQILKVKEAGWSLCKIPREPHTIGVRYGFSEAAPLFASQGLAALRPDENGDVVLDRGLTRERKVLKIAITRDGMVSSTSTALEQSDGSLEGTILAARDSLFEEELFHNLTLEARSLLAFDVTLESNIVHVPLSIRSSMDITLEPPSPMSEQQDTTEADAIALALRIQLTALYRERFLDRSKPPPYISSEPAPEIEPTLLKPVLTYLRHEEVISDLRPFLTGLAGILQHSGLGHASLSTTTEVGRDDDDDENENDNDAEKNAKPPHPHAPSPEKKPNPPKTKPKPTPHQTTAEALLDNLSQDWHTTFSLPTSPNPSDPLLKLAVKTDLDDAPHGTTAQLGSQPPTPDLSDLHDRVLLYLTIALSPVLAELCPGVGVNVDRTGRSALVLIERVGEGTGRGVEGEGKEKQGEGGGGGGNKGGEGGGGKDTKMEVKRGEVKSGKRVGRKFALWFQERKLLLLEQKKGPVEKIGGWTEDGWDREGDARSVVESLEGALESG
ncbi:MAG: RNA polymerase II mediator complex subunit [Chrysothrix sp. TS-e1954]|nr:MAG: RNA polymerase II mediator complex subunit [Chrysothrix sp. TS-e1954]